LRGGCVRHRPWVNIINNLTHRRVIHVIHRHEVGHHRLGKGVWTSWGCHGKRVATAELGWHHRKVRPTVGLRRWHLRLCLGVVHSRCLDRWLSALLLRVIHRRRINRWLFLLLVLCGSRLGVGVLVGHYSIPVLRLRVRPMGLYWRLTRRMVKVSSSMKLLSRSLVRGS
jgi:hypothetical protein